MALTKVTGQVIKNTTDVTVGVLTVTNTLAVGGTVSIGGTLTYEDVTNVDAVGLITARNGIVVGSGITLSKDGDGFFTGIVTATSFSGSGANLTGIDTDLVSDTSPQLGGNLDVNTKNIVFGDSGSSSDDRLVFGASSDLSIYHDGSHSRIVDSGTGHLIIQTSELDLMNVAGNADLIKATAGGSVELYENGTKVAETTSGGFNVEGVTYSNGLDMDDSHKILLGTDDDLEIFHNGSNAFIKNGTGQLLLRSGTHTFENAAGSTEYARIDSSGRLLIGATSAREISGHTPSLQLQGTQHDTQTFSIISNSADANPAYLFLSKQRSGAVGGSTIVQDGDRIGEIRFNGHDGNDFAHETAIIAAEVDGTPGTNDMPGRLIFATTADGAGAITERMRITAAGNVGVGINSPVGKLAVSDGTVVAEINPFSASSGAFIGTRSNHHVLFKTNATERMRLDTSGRLLLGTTTSNAAAGSLHVKNAYIRLQAANQTSSDFSQEVGVEWSQEEGSDVQVGKIVMRRTGWAGAPHSMDFYSRNSSNQVTRNMTIDHDGGIYFQNLLGNAASGSAVKYSNSDDELRYDTSSKLLKTNITELTKYGIDTVKKLKPSTFTPQEYNKDGTITVGSETLIGFIADEMVTEVPEVVQMYPKSTLTKQEEDTEIVPAAISYDKLTVVLTKALQEEIAKREALEARIAALEG